MRRFVALALLLMSLAGCTAPTDDVRIDYYVHGVLTLPPGGRLDIDVPVYSVQSGQRMPGYPVEGTATGGSLEKLNDRGLTYFRFQADRDIPPPYVITLTAGRDTVTLRIEAGWQFQDASYRANLDDNLPEIGETWSGRVCGDPFGEWQFERTVVETDVQNFESFAMVPRPLSVRGDQEYGGVPMIQPDPDGERHGGPPFLFWIDDVSPEGFVPSHQLIPVEVTPLSWEECR